MIPQLRGFSEFKASAVVLVAVNMLPLLGVLFLGWDTFSIITLYWTENVIIGAVNVLKMITCNPDPAAIDWSKLQQSAVKLGAKAGGVGGKYTPQMQLANHASKLFLIPFFIFHYGFFCLVHGAFVLMLFGHEHMGFGLFSPIEGLMDAISERHLWWCVIALAGSHLWSFFVNYLGRGEYRRTAVPILMVSPYARIIVLHVAILLGGFIVMALGSSVGALMILIISKTMLDLSLHLSQHAKIEMLPPTEEPANNPPIMPEVLTDEMAASPATPAKSER
jgi:hypothetical protein